MKSTTHKWDCHSYMGQSLRIGTAALLSLAILAQPATAQVPEYIEFAVRHDSRTEEMTARDTQRKPAEVLALAGVQPGDTVVEFAGFGNYYTTLLAQIVGPEGQVHIYDLPYTGRFGGAGNVAFVGANPQVSYHLGSYNHAVFPDNVDVVMNVLYYHDMHIEDNNVDVAALNRRIYDALKPGGAYLIIDHNAEAGSGKRDVNTVHRIDPAVIREELQAAGFELAEESDMLANPDDDLTKGPFDEGMRGNTDRTIFKFVKPAM